MRLAMAILVLDVDGVVVKGHPEGGRWDKNLERDLGLNPQRLQERFFRPHWKEITCGRVPMRDVLEQVWPQLHCDAKPDDLIAYWLKMDSRTDPETLAHVAVWREAGGKAFLGTVQEHMRARYLMEELGLNRWFDGMLYSAELGAAKPDAEFFTRAQAKLPVSDPTEVIFLDDQQNCVDGANAFGWQATRFLTADDISAALARADKG